MVSRCHPPLPRWEGAIRVGWGPGPQAAAPLDQGMLVFPLGFPGARGLGCPSGAPQGRHGHRLSPPFKRSQQMLSRLLHRWARKQRSAFKDRSSAGPDPSFPSPSPQHQPSVPLSGGAVSAPAPPRGCKQLPGPWLRRDRAAHLSSSAAPALRLLFATEELGGREDFSSRPRQELKTYALAANASPGARRDPGEPSTGFSTAAPAGAQPSCRRRRFKAAPGLRMVTARAALPSPAPWGQRDAMQTEWDAVQDGSSLKLDGCGPGSGGKHPPCAHPRPPCCLGTHKYPLAQSQDPGTDVP